MTIPADRTQRLLIGFVVFCTGFAGQIAWSVMVDDAPASFDALDEAADVEAVRRRVERRREAVDSTRRNEIATVSDKEGEGPSPPAPSDPVVLEPFSGLEDLEPIYRRFGREDRLVRMFGPIPSVPAGYSSHEYGRLVAKDPAALVLEMPSRARDAASAVNGATDFPLTSGKFQIFGYSVEGRLELMVGDQLGGRTPLAPDLLLRSVLQLAHAPALENLSERHAESIRDEFENWLDAHDGTDRHAVWRAVRPLVRQYRNAVRWTPTRVVYAVYDDGVMRIFVVPPGVRVDLDGITSEIATRRRALRHDLERLLSE